MVPKHLLLGRPKIPRQIKNFMDGMEETCSPFPQHSSLVGASRKAKGEDPIHE